MTKRGKLVGSIVVMLLIAIMVPFAIFATQNESIQNSNYVRFKVVDFQGEFYIGLIGNKNTQDDIGSITQGGNLSPSKLFTASYDDEKEKYCVYNVYNIPDDELSNVEPITNDKVEFPNINNNIEFDKKNSTITYYFVFVNTASVETVTNPTTKEPETIYHKVSVTTKTNPRLDSKNLHGTWSYVVDTTNLANDNFELPPTTDWTDALDVYDGLSEVDEIVVDACSNEGVYNYVLMKYTMQVDPDSLTNINSEFTITINLKSVEE